VRAIKAITPERARAFHDSFAVVASIANVDGCAISVRAKQMHGVCARYMALTPRSLSANPYRLADEIHGIGFSPPTACA